jgi:LysR family transcriptional regulator for metE and metH
MVPTHAGAVLLETAADVLGRLAETERAVKQPSEERSPLRVAAGCFTYYQWLSGALARFGADQPDIDVQIALGSTQRELQAVLDDEVDLAVTSRVQFDERLERRSLFTLDVVGVIGASHALNAVRTAARPGIRWGDLKNETILIHELGDSDVERLTAALTGEQPPRLWRVQLTEAMFELARARHGIGILTQWPQAVPPHADVAVVPLIPKQQREFWAVWRRGNPRALPLEALARRLGGDLSARKLAAAK